jgi:hypothetical protein
MSTVSLSRPAPPAEGTFKIDATTVDGRACAMLFCARCAWFNYHISRRFSSRIGQLFLVSDLDELILLAAAHECPPEVRDAA